MYLEFNSSYLHVLLIFQVPYLTFHLSLTRRRERLTKVLHHGHLELLLLKEDEGPREVQHQLQRVDQQGAALGVETAVGPHDVRGVPHEAVEGGPDDGEGGDGRAPGGLLRADRKGRVLFWRETKW